MSAELLAAARAALIALQSPILAPFLADWPDRLASHAPASLPVLRWMPQDGSPLVRAAASARLAWRRSYGAAALHPLLGERTAAFLDDYGWAELASQRIACGLLLLGPHTLYPRHAHPAEEVYLPLSGTAFWARGREGWRRHPPGALIHHLPGMPHAMRSGTEPLLALYLWRGALDVAATLG